MTPGRLPVVSVDLWDTVLSVGDRAAAQAWRVTEFGRTFAEFGLDVDDLDATVRHVLEQHAREQRHHGVQLRPEQQVRDILDRLHITADDRLMQVLITVHTSARLRACPEPVAGVPDTLRQLRAAGHRLVLSSNTLTCPGVITVEILADYGLTDLFDAFCFSDELGIAKPQPGFFSHVAAAGGVAPAQILHVGDDWRTDILGATRAGFAAAWFNPTGKARPGEPGHNGFSGMEFRDPTELISLVSNAAIIAAPRTGVTHDRAGMP